MYNKIQKLLIIIFLVIPFVVTFVVYPQLPQKIPTHWGMNGQVDGWSNKFPGAFYIPILLIVMNVLFIVLPKLDPRRNNYLRFKGTYGIFVIGFNIIFTLLHIITLIAALGYAINVDMLIKLVIGGLLLVIGNFMPKIRQTYMFGIRTPWTIANEHVWTITHRHAGRIWFIGSFVLLVAAFIQGSVGATIYFLTLLFIGLVPVVDSYLIYRRLDKQTTKKDTMDE